MKKTSYKKAIYLLIISSLTLSVSSCRLPGMPDKDPVSSLRGFYAEGKDGKASDYFIKYKLITETSDISYPAVEVRTLPSQPDKDTFDDPKHTLYHLALWDQSSSDGYDPLLTLDLLSDGDWHFDTTDNIITRHDDKVLFQLCYGGGRFATVLYSIKDDTFKELKPNSEFWPYLNHVLSGDEPYIFADTVTYDTKDYSTLHWYDWDGNIIKTIDNARTFFHDDALHYIVCTENNGLKQFDIYSADYDGKNEKLLGSVQEGNKNSNILCYYDVTENPVIVCQWTDDYGNGKEMIIPFSEFKGTTVCN